MSNRRLVGRAIQPDAAPRGWFARKLPSVAALSALLVLAGCSSGPSDRPATVPTRVQIRHEGKPVEGAQVTFINTEAQRTAFGTTDAEGWAKLMTFVPADGAVPGPQVVSVRKVIVTDKKKSDVDFGTTSQIPPPPDEKWLLPQKFADAKTSGLTATVTPGAANEIVLELK